MKRPKYTQQDVANLKEYKKTLKEFDTKISRLEKERKALDTKIDEISQITMFHDGFPVNISTFVDTSIYPVPDDGSRSAKIYHNAHKQPHIDDYGIYITDWDKSETRRTRWLETGHKKDDAMQIALDFVVHGKVPKGVDA